MRNNDRRNNNDEWIDNILNEVAAKESRNEEDRYQSLADDYGYMVRRSENTQYGMAIRF